MDPNIRLKFILEYAKNLLKQNGKPDPLAKAVLALDKWLSTGGALPKRWANAPNGSPR
jgi:hypothetical protein